MINPSRTSVIAALAVVAALVGEPGADAYAQMPEQIQTLRGTVQDHRGLPLLGAFVAVVALGSDQPAAVVVTDAHGEFLVSQLRHGVYSLLVGSLGFAGTVMQGVNVPTAMPVSLQLEALSDRALSAYDSPLDRNWALRSAKRDVLRQTDTRLVDETGDAVSADPGLWAPVGGTENALARPMVGEFRLWSIASTGDHDTVGVSSLSLSGDNSWHLKAHTGDRGALWAAGDLLREFDGGHSVKVGFGYVGGSFGSVTPDLDADGSGDSSIGRLEIHDTWQVAKPVTVSYGVRYERHGYLADGSLLSPSVEVSIAPRAGTRLTTGVASNATGLDLTREDSGFEVMSLLGQSNLRVADTARISPQRSMRYHLGLEQRVGAAQVRVAAYYDDVTDELLGVYVADPAGTSNYLLFNVGNSNSRGFELGVAGELMRAVSGEITYSFRDRDADYPLMRNDGIAPADTGLFDWTVTQMHEVQASVAAELAPSHTRLVASYNWRRGMPVVRDGELERQYGRLDLRVRQLLPIRALDTEWSAVVQIRNLLGPDYDGLYNVSLAELIGLTGGFAGGVAVRF